MSVFGTAFAPEWLGLAAFAVLAGGFIRGFAGFGSALAIIPVLAVVFEPAAAVAMHAVIELPIVAMLLPPALREAERSTVAPMLLALLATTPLGALVLKTADVGAMRTAISVAVLLMVALVASQHRVTALLGPIGATCAGAFGGLMQGATGLGGPPVVAAVLARQEAAGTSRANLVVVMSGMILLSLATFTLYGMVTPTVLAFGAVAAPLCLLGTAAGARSFRRNSGRHFRIAALAVVTVMALASLAAGEVPAGH